MRILVLGGTKFLGRAFVEAALARRHELTLFNRGETNADLFPNVEKLRGDRRHDLSALRGRTLGRGRRPVRVHAGGGSRLPPSCSATPASYLFVSSVSVYADFSVGPDEDSPVTELGEASSLELAEDFSNYGALKALCEQAVQDVFGERSLIVRPGLIVGPHDPTGRFTYWAHRLARGGEILAPGPAGSPARSSSTSATSPIGCSTALERGVTGVFNATNEGVAWGELLAGADVTWVSDEHLVAHEVGEWMELPLWLADPAWAGMHRTDVGRAVGAGLTFRPLAETIAGAAEAPAVEGVGLTPEREAELLRAWRGQ